MVYTTDEEPEMVSPRPQQMRGPQVQARMNVLTTTTTSAKGSRKRPPSEHVEQQAKQHKRTLDGLDGESTPWTLGTDASGFENGMRAAHVANLRPTLVFTCERDKKLRSLIRNTFAPRLNYTDMTTRNNAAAPTVDLFITSPSCQPWSPAGQRAGRSDERGAHVFETMKYVTAQKPRVVIMEEVPALAQRQ